MESPIIGIFNVEKILNKRLVNGKVQYKIKWEGFTDEESTWEYKEDCFCYSIITEFEIEYSKYIKNKNNNYNNNTSIISIFKIEKIIDKRIIDNKIEYKIKWEGYSIKESSWLDKYDIPYKDLIYQFEKEYSLSRQPI